MSETSTVMRSLSLPGKWEVRVEVGLRFAARRVDDGRQVSVAVAPGERTCVVLPEGVGRIMSWGDERIEPDGARAWRLRCGGELAKGWAFHDAAIRFELDVDDWRLVLPSGWGRELDTLPPDLDYQGNYPGWSALAQLIVLQGPEGGLSVSVRDAHLELKYLRARRDGARLAIEVVRVPERHGETWQVAGQCDVLLATHAGAWDRAATDYRRRQEQVRPELRAPHPLHPLLAADPVWLTQNCFCFPSHSAEETVAAARELAAPVLCHFYNWSNAAFDTRYPDWAGVRREARRQIEILAAAGIPVVPYINGRCWDTTTDSWRDAGYAAAVRNLRGDPETEIYPTSNIDLGVTCPSQRVHHDKLLGVCRELAGCGLGFPGVYIDQLGAAFGLRCYAPDHGHAPGGARSWNHGQRELVSMVRSTLAERLGHEPLLTIENAAEPLVDLIDGFLYYCGRPHERLGRPVPLWQAIYGDLGAGFADNFGKDLGPVDGNPPPAMMEKLARQAIFGANLGWLSPGLVTGPYAAAGELIRNARAARMPVIRFFRSGRPCPDALDTTGERSGVLQAAWACDDKVVALAVNPTACGVDFIWADGRPDSLAPFAARHRRLD